MYLLYLLGAISLLIATVAAESSEVFYWPVGSPQPSLLARVAYDPATLKSELVSYHPPASSHNDLVRIGLYTATPSNPKQWSGSLVSLSALTGDDQPTIRLHLGPSNKPYHISLAASSSSGPQVELISNVPGTQPHLNRPVVVGPDGSNPEDVPEKTLFQK